MGGTAVPVRTNENDSGNVWLEGLLTKEQWSSGWGTTVISTYIADEENVHVYKKFDIDALDPKPREAATMRASMNLFEEVSNIDFRMVGSQADADLIWTVTSEMRKGATGLATLPGEDMNVPLTNEQTVIAINAEVYDPTFPDPDALVRGGWDFITFIHELGHAMGLGHPHESRRGSTAFPGVDQPVGDYGAHDMSQGIYTMMTYNDGWWTGPQGITDSHVYGDHAGPMALDIAALQHMYGANMSTRTGNDTYRLPEANQVGTFYTCIWDAGGTDQILGASRLGNSIDLNAATLLFAPGGGGFVSHAKGIHGGFTIANGVVVENATGGARQDVLTGNGAANALVGLTGADKLIGRAGNDTLLGGAGQDRLTGGAGQDNFVFTALKHSSAGATCDRVKGFVAGQDEIVLTQIDAKLGAAGNQAFVLDAEGPFEAGEIRQRVVGGDLLLEMNVDKDAQAEMSILLRGFTGTLTNNDFEL